MTSIETQTEGVVAAHSLPRMALPRGRSAVVRFAVCTVTLWLAVLLLALLVVVGVYTSQANQLLVVSCVSVVSIALVVASCKLNALAGIHKMVEEDMAAKSDPPPTYDDVLHSEAPPPSYYSVVSEATGGSASPAATRNKQDIEPAKVMPPPAHRRSPAFRRWLGRPGILQTLVSPSVFRAPRGASPPSPVQSTKASGCILALRRSSSTPSLAGLSMQPSMARSPSSPSLCEACAWF